MVSLAYVFAINWGKRGMKIEMVMIWCGEFVGFAKKMEISLEYDFLAFLLFPELPLTVYR